MDFSLIGVYDYIYDKMDKIGSDLFQLDTVRNFFIQEAYGFVTERCNVIEATQAISDDIRPLVVPTKLNLVVDPFDPYLLIAAFPKNYLRTLRINSIKKNGIPSENPNKISWAEYDNYKKNPLRSPDSENPIILQRENFIVVDQGVDTKINEVSLIYCRKPIFAGLDTQTDRIVDLPDESILEIINNTIVALDNSIGDPRAASNYQQNQTFKKISR